MSPEPEAYSAGVYALERELTHVHGLTVNLFCFDMEDHGGITYAARHIDINCQHALPALMTLAHEAGHWFHSRRDPRFQRNEQSRAGGRHERKAYLYGWAVLRRMGLDTLVGRDRWVQFHPEVLPERAIPDYWLLADKGPDLS